jgi:prepilin-type N-terminal cleavage/methylation domain-containing protein
LAAPVAPPRLIEAPLATSPHILIRPVSETPRQSDFQKAPNTPPGAVSRQKRTSQKGASPAPGFTLLEMVLSLAIVGLIVALVSAGLDLAGTAIGGGERAAEQNQRIRLAADIMMREIKSAVLYPARDEDYEYPFFRGARRDLAFVTAAAQSGGGGLALVTYRVQGDPPQLVLSETSVLSRDVLGGQGELGQLPGEEAVLLEGFTDLYFEYLMNDGVENEWFESWSGKEEEELPAAVRVVVEGMAGLGGGRWSQQIPLMIASFGEVQPDLDEVVPDPDI